MEKIGVAGKPGSSNYSCSGDPIPEFEAVDDVQPADDAAEGREIALVVRLRDAAQSVAGPARVETR